MNIQTTFSIVSRQAARRNLSRLQPQRRRIAALSTLTKQHHQRYSPSYSSASTTNTPCTISTTRSYAQKSKLCSFSKLTKPASRAQFHTATPMRENSTKHLTPADITTDTYHSIADATLDDLYVNLEALSEVNTDVEVDYSSGVMTFSNPQGTWVINKQPPNKQIWLSSPISGPKRYDWVDPVEKDDGNGSEGGDWVYLRDGHAMSELLQEELGVSYVIEE